MESVCGGVVGSIDGGLSSKVILTQRNAEFVAKEREGFPLRLFEILCVPLRLSLFPLYLDPVRTTCDPGYRALALDLRQESKILHRPGDYQ
jgi:hypothetical protein